MGKSIRRKGWQEMTRDDAIKIFNTLLLFGKCDLRKEEAEECFKMAIKALEEQPSERTEERTETHECDYISRKAVLDALHRYFADGFDSDKWWNSTYVLDAVNRVPSATPQPKTGQPKTGHWIEHKHGGIEHIECSKCRCWFLRKDLIRNSYCPNCGSYNGGDTNPQPSENLNVVLDELNRIGRNAFKDDTDYDNLFDFISNLPSVSSQPKTAHWEWTQYDSKPNFGNWHCSACRSIVVEHVPKTSVDGIPLYKYCPQCGAKMQEVQQ